MVSASHLFSYPYEKQTMICQCLFITREGHVILSGLGWQLLGQSRQDRHRGHSHTLTATMAGTDTQAAIHVLMLIHIYTYLHLPPSQCDNPDGILVTAVTREREGACTTDSRLCKTADMQLCVFCVVKQPQEQQYIGSIQCTLKLGSVHLIFGFK